jgi:hypothetical protein
VNVSFELPANGGEISKVRFELVAVPKLDDATWFVRLAGERVTIHARKGEVGHASWVRGRLIERAGAPSDQQWKMIGTALARVIRRAKPSDVPLWRRVPRVVIGPIIMIFVAIVATVLIFNVRSNEPARDTIAPFDKLRWADVAHGGETTPPLILKDATRERGRKLCVTGTVDKIEAATVDARNVHVGTLRTTEGDALPFIALRSTRSIVARSAGRFCGVVHDKQIVGLFELPENL